MRQGQIKRLKIVFRDRPLPYETATRNLAMKLDSATGRPQMARIPVRPGKIVTVLAFGEVDPDGPNGPLPPSSASGTIRREAPSAGLSAVGVNVAGYLLNNVHYTPSQWVGTLVGSFDNFKTSFIIGTNASMMTPANADTLYVAANGTAADYRVATGGYELKSIIMYGPRVPTANSEGYGTSFDGPFFFPPWGVLTAAHVRAFYEEAVVNPRTHQAMIARVPFGAVHMSIYESRR